MYKREISKIVFIVIVVMVVIVVFVWKIGISELDIFDYFEIEEVSNLVLDFLVIIDIKEKKWVFFNYFCLEVEK